MAMSTGCIGRYVMARVYDTPCLTIYNSKKTIIPLHDFDKKIKVFYGKEVSFICVLPGQLKFWFLKATG
jgi:hypothetical protein